jgi:hypothetical protein
MTKIPVGKTIAQAYAFGFGDFFKILGVMWLPMAVVWLPGFFVQRRMLALQAQLGAGNLSVFHEMWPILVPFYLAIFFLLFMQIIGIAKLALGLKKGPVWFYFSLCKPVWRLIGNFLLMIAAVIVGVIAVFLGGFLIGFVLRLITNAVNNGLFTGIVGVIAIVAMIALWCAYIYGLVRLTFFMVPVIAAEEEGFALARSWTLGWRNFWRMFVVLLAVLGPIFILEFVLIFGFMLRGIAFPPPHADAAQKAAFQIAMNARSMAMMEAVYHYWYLSFPILIVVMVVFYGAYVGAPCFAYRALMEAEASAPVAAD